MLQQDQMRITSMPRDPNMCIHVNRSAPTELYPCKKKNVLKNLKQNDSKQLITSLEIAKKKKRKGQQLRKLGK
jgi:hypothetical protein